MISNTYANKILNVMCGVADNLSIPANLYLGLCSGEPVASNGAITGEPTAASYSRIVVGGSSGTKHFGQASGGIISNSEEIQFKTAREDFGTMNYFFLAESQTGPAIMWGEISGGVTIGADTVPTFYEGELRISLDVALN